MASKIIAEMSAKLGLDPAEFLDKMKGVQGVSAFTSASMARQWKDTAREGNESFRLIDEALGLHISRPLTHLLTSEFPAFASGLQSILGGAAFGALATIGFEAFEHVSRSIEKAQHAQEEFRAASAKVGTTLQDIGDTWALQIKKLQGQKSAAAIISEGVQEAKRQFDELGKSIDEANKKRIAGSGRGTRIWAGIGDAWDSATQGSSVGIDKEQQAQTDKLKAGIDNAYRADTLNSTHTALALIIQDLKTANDKLKEYRDLGVEAFTSPAMFQQQTDGLDRQIAMLTDAKKNADWEADWENKKNQAEAAAKAAQRLKEDTADWNREHAKAWEWWLKLNDEIDKAAEKLQSTAFSEIGKRFQQQRAQMAPWIQVTPTLAPGASEADAAKRGSAAGQFSAFAADDAAQSKMVEQAFRDAVGPAGELQLKIQEIKLAFSQLAPPLRDSAQAQAALTAEIAKFQAEEVGAEDKVHRLQVEMQHLLEYSKNASDGWRAFVMSLQIKDSDAKMLFDELTTGLKGAEDATAKSIVDVLENIHGSHAKLMKQLKSMWESYFASLTEMAIKSSMTKLLAEAAGALAKPNTSVVDGMVGDASQMAAPKPKFHAGRSLIETLLGSLGGSVGATGASAAPGSGLMVGGIGDIGQFADGGDVAPGGSFIAGEAGAEEVDLNSSGAKITPMGGKSAGGDSHYYDLRGAVVTDDLLRRAEAAHMMAQTKHDSIATAVSMSQDIARRGGAPR
jgi:hypothetical protein